MYPICVVPSLKLAGCFWRKSIKVVIVCSLFQFPFTWKRMWNFIVKQWLWNLFPKKKLVPTLIYLIECEGGSWATIQTKANPQFHTSYGKDFLSYLNLCINRLYWYLFTIKYVQITKQIFVKCSIRDQDSLICPNRESGITKNIYKLNVHVGTDGETSRNAIPLSYKTYNLVTTFFCPFQKRYFQW